MQLRQGYRDPLHIRIVDPPDDLRFHIGMQPVLGDFLVGLLAQISHHRLRSPGTGVKPLPYELLFRGPAPPTVVIY